MGRLAFVTGATGFVGAHLVDELIACGWRVRALVRATSRTQHLRARGADLFPGDLSDAAHLAKGIAGADTVFHLAAVTAARSEAEYARANAEGTRALAAAVMTAEPPPRRLVYLSSYAAAGPALNGAPRPVTAPPEPLTAYGRSKLAGEHLVVEAGADGAEIVVLRAPVVYGPGDRALLPYFRLVRRGLAPAPGGGDRRLHLIFAPDLAGALRRAADGPTGTFAVAEPVEHAWSDIAGVIARELGRRPLRISLPAPLVRSAAAITELAGRLAGRAVPFNREKAEEMLAHAWTSELPGAEALLPAPEVTPLADGIGQTIRWYIRQGWL